MAKKTNRFERIWGELKRRKVIHVITVYAATAFVILELVSMVAQPLKLPEWTEALVIVLLCIGFVIAVFLSWIYDITPAGVSKTKPASTVKHVDQTTTPTSSGWKIASYISGAVIVALVTINLISRRNINADISKLEKSIAVLPFINDSPSDSNQYFINGIMEEVLNNLQKIKDFRVLSRTSTDQYVGPNRPTVPEIAKKLHVNYIIEGSGQKYGNTFILRVQLIAANEEKHLWGESYEQEIKEVKDYIRIQSQIAQAIARELNAVITPEEEKSIKKTPTNSLIAHDLLWKARNSIGMERLRLLNEALTYDSNYAAIYAEKGAWWLWYAGGWKGTANSNEVLANALPLITKALEIDPNIAEAHYALAGLQIWYFWNFEASEKEYKIALQLDPLNAEIIHDYTDLLDAAGRFAEALEWSNKGVDADPTTLWEKGLRAYFMNQYETAITTYEEPISLDPDPNRYIEEARFRLYIKQYHNVISLINSYLEHFPDDRAPRPMGTLAIAYLKTRQIENAQLLLNEIKGKSQKSPAGSPSFYVAMIYTQMGETDLAFEWLDKAFEAHEIEMYWLKVEPPFEPLRIDPRWQTILKKVGFPEN